MTFDKNTYHEFIFSNGVFGFFPEKKRLASGRESHFYVNWRKVSSDAFLTDRLAEMVIDFTAEQSLTPDTFHGVPAGASKLAIITQYLWAKSQPTYGKGSHALSLGREKPKEHGDAADRLFVGLPRGRTIILEDVTTTGDSLLREMDRCLEAQVNIIAAIGLTNRMEVRDDRNSVEQAVREKGIPYFAMSTALDLLPLAYQRLRPGREIGLAVEKEFKQFGIQPIRLVEE